MLGIAKCLIVKHFLRMGGMLLRSWSETDWSPQLTQDGSWSLRIRPDGELMHSPAGAYGESQYIYGALLHRVSKIELTANISILSLGLGLGYNELLAIQWSLEKGLNLSLFSFEKDPFLKEALKLALAAYLTRGAGRNNSVESKTLIEGYEEPLVQEVYFHIFSWFPISVIEQALRMLNEGQWQLLPALAHDSQLPTDIQVYFWDAFSRKTSPELWDEDFLKYTLQYATHPQKAWLTTYACNGPLKRSLRALGWQVFEEKGFHNKKKHVWAEKNRELDP